MMNNKNNRKIKLSASDLEQFSENRWIFNKAVVKAIKENNKSRNT